MAPDANGNLSRFRGNREYGDSAGDIQGRYAQQQQMRGQTTAGRARAYWDAAGYYGGPDGSGTGGVIGVAKQWRENRLSHFDEQVALRERRAMRNFSSGALMTGLVTAPMIAGGRAAIGITSDFQTRMSASFAD